MIKNIFSLRTLASKVHVFVILMIFAVSSSYGQVTFFSENMGTPAGTTTIALNTFQNSAPVTFSGTGDVRTTLPSTGPGTYTGASGGGNIFVTNAVGTFFQISGINSSLYTGIALTVGQSKSTVASNNELIIEVNPDNTAWTALSYTRPTGSGTAIWTLLSPAGTIPAVNNLSIRFRNTSTTASFRIDDVKLTGTLVTGKQTAQVGDWYTGSTWVGGVAPSNSESCTVLHNITALTPVTRDAGTTTTITAGSITSTALFTNNGAMTVAVGAMFAEGTSNYVGNGATNINGTFRINNGGWATGSTNFTYGGAGTLQFNTNGNYDVFNIDTYWPAGAGRPFNVNVLQANMTLTAGTARTVDGVFSVALSSVGGVVQATPGLLTINGTCRIDNGGYFGNVSPPTNSPIYGPSSTLVYNIGPPLSYGRAGEWTSGVGTIGVTPGYPNNVQVTNNTIFDYPNGAAPGIKGMAGNLTVDVGSAFYMDYNFISTAGALIVAGNVTVGGTLSLGTVLGDDLKMGGNLAFTGTGTLSGNNRAIFFTKNGPQTISSVQPLSIPYVVIQQSGVAKVQLLCNLTVGAGNTGNAIVFTNPTDIFDINGYTLTVGTIGIANVITGTGTFSGSATSNLTLKGLATVGTIYFTPSFQNLGTLTLDREGTKIGCTLGTAVTIATKVDIIHGLIDLGNNVMTIANAATIAVLVSPDDYIIADLANGSSASLRKVMTAPGSFTYPIGDRTGVPGTPHYTPVTVNFASGTFASAWAGMAVDDIKEPNMDANTHYITRYWNMTSSGITSPNYTVTGTYLPVDIVGSEITSYSNQWNGTAWTNGGAPLGSNTMTIGGCTTLPAINHFTGGYRNPEINVQQSAVNYLTGSTFDFGTVLTGSSNVVTFTIQNLGQQNLNLSPAVITGGPNYIYTTAYPSTVAPLGSQTFVITFSPTAAGTFTGSISIPNNDPSGSENPYIINFTGIGTVPVPEINVKGVIGADPTILSGDITPNPLDNTQFMALTIGASQTKTFRIENIGTANLSVPTITLTGVNPADFSIVAATPYNIAGPAGTVTFTVTFAPVATGVRTAIVNIANNDATGSESPYTFMVEGTGNCPAGTNTITPTSGPVNTEVTVTATVGNLSGATATFNGTAATVTQISSTQIKVIVPAGATSGNLVTTNSLGCTAATVFNVIIKSVGGCEGGSVAGDLFISEVTDESTGSLSYVEIYNGTGAAVNLATGNYSLRVHNNGGAGPMCNFALTGTVANNGVYVVSMGGGSSPEAGGVVPNQTEDGCFAVNDNDNIRLYKNGNPLDQWGFQTNTTLTGIGTKGYTFRRKNTATPLPSTTFVEADWDVIDADDAAAFDAGVDYSNMGTYDYSTALPPTVTLHPVYTPTCKAASLTVAGTQGFAGGFPLAYQWYSAAPNAATWTALTNTGVYTGATAATLNISNVTGLDGYQYYCQIRENTSTCYSASNAVKISDPQTVTWNGTVWSPNAPTISSVVVINGNYNTATNGSFECCSMTVNSGSTVTITSNAYISIKNDLTVSTGGNMVVQNQGSLVMIEDTGVVTNSGTTTVQKTTASYERYDYTYWSSPVAGNTIGSTFSAWRTDYSFSFNTANFADLNNDTFDDAAPYAWTNTGTAAVMTPGKGYAIMAPTVGTFPTTSSVVFSGAANNGVITLPVALSGNAADANDDYNLIGNPYASAIWANTFILNNPAISGTLYFWTHVSDISVSNPGPNAQNFISDDYAVYNLTGGTRASFTGSPFPTGYISSGQGFLVEAASAGNVTFNNSMRDKAYSNAQFFRNASEQSAAIEKDRIWLNLQNQDGMFSQQLIGYFDDATLGIDRGFDGIVNTSNNYISFYSFIGNEKFRIQGRNAFDINDTVYLGYSSVVAGAFNISIDNKEGALNGTETDIYLEDRLLNVIHDLKQGPYVFTTAIGTFDDRFVLRYTNAALGNANFEVNDNSVVVAANDTQIEIKSDNEPIESVTIYDVLGRTILNANEVHSRSFVTDKVTAHQQALIVRVTLANQQVVVRKIIF